MYLISIFPDQADSQPNKLVGALIKAKERGVDVKIILDQNLDFQEETRDDIVYNNKNQQAYELFKRNKIPVFFDEADTYTHAKALIIDHETVILGSTNWSKTALTRNNEANALIRSKEFAKNLSDSFSKIKLQEVPAVFTPTINISQDFLLKENLLGEMVSQADDRIFDAYLYLISQYSGNKESKVTLSYDKLAEFLSINQMSAEDYRRQIKKVLTKLRDKYKLIDFENPKRNQDAHIILKDMSNQKKLYAMPETNFFQVPTTYWKFDWIKTLTFPAKVMYLIDLSYTSAASPNFYMSRDTLSKKHHISNSFISDGTRELKRLNLLDVKYGNIEGKNYSERDANVYTPKPLYDPEDLAKDFKSLESKHGKEQVDRIKQIAAIVFEENNIRTIQALIELENKYGKETLQQAAKQIADKNPDNPKRSAGYLINTVKDMGYESA